MSNVSLNDTLYLIVALHQRQIQQQQMSALMNLSSSMDSSGYFSPGGDVESMNWLLTNLQITALISDLIGRLAADDETGGEHAHYTPPLDSDHGPRGLPLDRIEVSSPFGRRWGRHHDGIDLRAKMLDPIYAVKGGTVTFAGWMGGYGNCIEITTGSGTVHRYGHCNDIGVRPRQEVTAGQSIGRVGNTGHSIGPHLHFEVRANGVPIDPWPLLRKA